MADAAEQAPGATEYILHHQSFLSNKAAHGIVDAARGCADLCRAHGDALAFRRVDVAIANAGIASTGALSPRAARPAAPSPGP